MKKKFKILTFLFALVLSLFISVGTSVFAAESAMNTRVMEEVERYVNNGTLPSWHLNYYEDEGSLINFYTNFESTGFDTLSTAKYTALFTREILDKFGLTASLYESLRSEKF